MADNNKTDYTKPRTDLLKLLPEPLQSDVNISLFNNVFNRYLTKQEIKKVAGYIGEGNPNALTSRQIHEADVHRQAYQLQPIPYNKIGSVEHMTSWKDMQNELERVGVDISKFSEWGATQKFNWVPPIDINKIVNYRDYYWVDPDGIDPIPQYITIRSTCATATARYNFWQGLIEQHGSTFQIGEILPSDATPAEYTITEFTTSAIKVAGDATTDILFGDWVDLTGTSVNDGTYHVTGNPVYSGVDNETTLPVAETLVASGSPLSTGLVKLRRFTKIVLPQNLRLQEGSPAIYILDSGNYTSLFTEGFIFYVRSSTNTDLGNAFVEAVSSTYDGDTKETTVIIKNHVTDNTADGELSLEEQLSVFDADKSCQCGDFGGWDISLWDDNPSEPLWGDTENATGSPIADGISDHLSLIARISNPTPPISGVGTGGELWYDTVANILYQATIGSPISWVIIYRNFSLILDETTGADLWDLAVSCDTRPRIDATNQWISQNKWFHKNDVENFSSATRANQPIIEYDWDLELNEWTRVEYNWSYRNEKQNTFTTTTTKPSRIELEPLSWWQHVDGTSEEIVFDDRYGDLSDYFVEGVDVYFVSGLTKLLRSVASSVYKTVADAPYKTYVTFTTRPPQPVGSPSAAFNNLDDARPNTYSITPTLTSQGDLWEEYGSHWLFLGQGSVTPAPHQTLNPYMEINITDATTAFPAAGSPVGSPVPALEYEYTSSLYAQNYLLAQDRFEFLLSDDILPNSSRRLTRLALFGHNDVRVYASDAAGEDVVREFGTYDEIGEAVFDITAIDFIENEFVVGGTLVTPDLFLDTHIIRVADNTGAPPTDYVVDHAADPTNPDRIRVLAAIDTATTSDGNISNVTAPVPDADFVNTQYVTIYVRGVEFFAARPAGTNIQIILGESAIDEIGTGIVNVRTEVDNALYEINGDIPISTTTYRKVEQLKTNTQQYPLFDIFTVTGEPAYAANAIFGYKISPDAPINQAVGMRIVHDVIDDIYEFDQFLLAEDNAELFAYRDYANKQGDYWYNEETHELKFWDDNHWTDKAVMSEFYRRAIVSPTEPNATMRAIDGLYWYNTEINKLFIRHTPTFSWLEVTDVDQLVTDANLQTIWKAGTNNDLYIPAEVDWYRRTEAEYNDERLDFINNRVDEIQAADPSISYADALLQATDEWYASQANHISENGQWVGDWEIPDPLYYNHLHENRKYLDSRELLAHFTTIINEQPDVPGWTGTKAGQFNIVHINDVNYALGGTIKEFNNGFDTLISSVMVNNVTPRSLIEFAHDQYESLLNTIREIYRENSVSVLSDVSTDNILNVSPAMADAIINLYELNDAAAFIYGDSTTFTDNDGVNDVGVRNWIATLPYLKLITRSVPQRLIDTALGLNDVVHHDGHRASYEITEATADIIAKTLIGTADPRFSNETMGIESPALPANNITEFDASFSTISSREGVYWYHDATPKVLYRYTVAESGTTQPPSSLADGTLWMDLTVGLEVLRIKQTDLIGLVSWNVVSGLTIGDGRLHNGSNPADLTTAVVSAWQVIDLSEILGDVIFELENRLYDNAPTPNVLNYDFEETITNDAVASAQYFNESFLSYISQSEIEEPFKNVDFDSSDPFTWNYKRSAAGSQLRILEAAGLTNSFIVSGNKTASFSAGVTFYVKNSGRNDGTWETISTTYDGTNTTVYVTGDVLDDVRGSIYSGRLPSPISTFIPNNLNDGSESGGCWQDIYEKFYGTPYPHLEPWTLQGYATKPTWWDAEYANTDIDKWGSRTWKYKHGFDITSVTQSVASPVSLGFFGFGGEFTDMLISTSVFNVDKSNDHAGTYTVSSLDTIQSVIPGVAGIAGFVVDDTSGFASSAYVVGMKISIIDGVNNLVKSYIIKNTNLVGVNLTIIVEEEILVGDLVATVDYINGVVYTPITNETRIYVDEAITVGTIEGRVAVPYGMWENIRVGVIPPGAIYPNGITSATGIPSIDAAAPYGLTTEVLPTFNYFSVNIDNITVSADAGTTNFAPDDLLPPYWDHLGMYPAVAPTDINTTVRSLFFVFGNEIISPNANYTFNDRGTVEWEWSVASQYLYDTLAVAYRLDPANFIYKTFGFNFTTIGGLLIDRDVKNTTSHTRTNFHGDVVDNAQFKSEGLNQWYVNFNRYDGYDTNFSDFQSLWTLWTAPLTYQMASYVDTPSLSLAHRYLDLTDFDYEITSKRSAGVEDFWLDAFDIQIETIPYDVSNYNNQSEWVFDVRTNISQTREIKYYDVHNYQFRVNATTNECTIYSWNIIDVNTFDDIFVINGNQTTAFATGRQFSVTDSSGNDGTYTIVSTTYDVVTKLTTVAVDSPILSPTRDGIITLSYRSIPWETGQPIYLSTNELMPIPLDSDTVIGTTKYFIIKTSDTTFKVANTSADALAGIEISITTEGLGDHFVGELLNTFNATATGNINWRSYAIDTTNVLTWSTPNQIQGMQSWVDIIHGYAAYTNTAGWTVNADRSLRDPDTGVIVTWQVELERFIDYAYSTRIRRSTYADRYPVTVDVSTNEFIFDSTNNVYITGDPVVFLSSNFIFPTPISRNIQYYVIRDTLDKFKIAASRVDAQQGNAINIVSTTGVGSLSISTPAPFKYEVPSFEMNPFRNAIWFTPPTGIVSNVITGPVEDIRTTQLIFDQNGDNIKVDQLRVYRQDKETKIIINDAVNTAPELTFLPNSEYNNLHLGGLHIFTDTYEHVIMFNNYSAGDNLLYDPFIGLNVTKYETLFNRNVEFTGRPNVGGYYLETFFDQGANIKENFEAGVENLRNAYDTYDTLESNLMTSHSRDALGYEGETDYLTNLNVSEKSQFIFWRGQIQNKGSINAVTAYINSRRFIDAKMDEFWAIRVATFGSMGEKEYPEMYATTVDARSNEFKVEFIDNEDNGSGVSAGFTPIRMSDQDRWYNQPLQAEVLRNNGKVMYFDMKIVSKLDGTPVDLNGNTEGSPLVSPIDIENSYIVHNLGADAITMTDVDAITLSNPAGESTDFEYINPNVIKLTGSPLPSADNIKIYGYVVNNDTQNPSRLVDRLSATQLSTIEIWDPARGSHYSNAIHNVDLQNAADPAIYASTPQTIVDSRVWTDAYIGKSWMDTSTMDYVPYHSDKVITDDDIRFREWGQLYDYASINLYEWVESDVLPSAWDVIAETEAGDNTIPEAERKSGVAKFTLFEPIGSPIEWVPLKNKVDTHYAAVVPTFTDFTPSVTVLDNTKSIDVYVNESLHSTVEPVGSPAALPLTVVLQTNENDIVKFVQAVPTDADVIAAEIAAGNLLQEYEYTTVSEYDSFGRLSNKYYFWVGDKSTKPSVHNRSMSLLEAQQQLVNIPSAYMFFQKPLGELDILEDALGVDRIEYFTISGSPISHVYTLELVVQEGTTILVDIDGADVPSEDISYITSGSPLTTTVTLNTLVGVGGSPDPTEVKITYTGLDSNVITTLPNRFSQVIIRGLQGIVFDDSRYTIRFTRDFTLRDNLDVVNENLGPLDLNNLHEEWKIFRQEQSSKIDRWMWDKVTESMVGYTLADPTVRVPSYEYELYDEKYDADTQYGLDTNQSFVNGTLAISTILAYLIDPDVTFTPIDINIFFSEHNFDTADDIITAMDSIYNTFTITNINRMYFSVLHDAFTTKAKYPGIFKTSMVSLHGIRPFQSNGVFDD